MADPTWSGAGTVALDALGLVGPAKMAVEGAKLVRSGVSIADAAADATRVVGATASERLRSFLPKDPYLLGWGGRVAGTAVVAASGMQAARDGELGLVHVAQITRALMGNSRAEEDPALHWDADFAVGPAR